MASKTEDFDINEITDPKEQLNISQFELGDDKNSKTQKLFYFVLYNLIEKYNRLGKRDSEKEGIYYLNGDNILLANLTDELVQGYLKYKELFKGLMSGEASYYPKYDPNKRSNKAFSYNNDCYEIRTCYSNNSGNSGKNKYYYTDISYKKMKKKYFNSKQKKDEKEDKIMYQFNQFANYFNGMYFESIATETFFNLIYKKYTEEDGKKMICFLPKIIFYKKKKDQTEGEKEYHGYNEIDCAFILKEKEEVKIDQEMITCFKSFDINDEEKFYNIDNFKDNPIIQKDNVVIFEIKSKWENLKIIKEKSKDQYNLIEKFIRKAKGFVNYYEKLNLIKKNQKKILIYLYDNSLHYNCNIKEENEEIRRAFDMIKPEDNIQLYIAYFQSYLKMMNSFDRVKKIKTLTEQVNNYKKDMNNMENRLNQQMEKINKQQDEIIGQREIIKKQKEDYELKFDKINDKFEQKLKKLEESKNKEIEELRKLISEIREGNGNIPSNNSEEKKNNYKEKGKNDKNEKDKKNSISSGLATTSNTITNDYDKDN